jgi:hypothetical protein
LARQADAAVHRSIPAPAVEAVCKAVLRALRADSFRAHEERAVFRKVSIVVETNDLIAANEEEALLKIALCISIWTGGM